MKAALLNGFAQPLVLEDVSVPTPGPGQVLVRILSSGVCHSDVHIARGEWEKFKSLIRLPLILGHEVSGRVERVGPGVKIRREGDLVGVPWFHRTCGECEYCRRDLEVYCDKPAFTGVHVDGGFAEFTLAWESHAIPIPRGLALDQAAPLFCAGGTVYSALQKVKLDESVRLGIWGAGGLGHYAIQLGKNARAHVTAVDPVPAKLTMARELGADAAVTVAEQGEWFREPKNRVDVALICATAAQAYSDAIQGLRKNGHLLVVGIPSTPISWPAGDLIRSGARIIPSRVASRRELRDLLEIAVRGEIHSELQHFKLENINNVMDSVGAGTLAGRAVIDF